MVVIRSFLTLLIIYPLSITASPTSQITVPLSIDLKSLEGEVQKMIPVRLATIKEPRKVCVKSEWFTAKIPYTRCTKGNGYIPIPKCGKAYKYIKTRLTPELKCNTEGWVNRIGNISIEGSNNKIKVSLPIDASVSAKNIGGIIKSETAKATAIVSASASLDIDSNWEAKLNIDPTYHWTKRPVIKLLDFIKISIGSKVEPELNKMIAEQKKEIPAHLEKLKIKKNMNQIWMDVQKPILVLDSPKTYVLVSPQSVSFPGFNISNNKVTGNISITATTEIIVSDTIPEVVLKELPNLNKEKTGEPGFNIQLPITVKYDELVKTFAKEFPKGLNIDLKGTGMKGVAKLSNIELNESDGGLKILASVDYDDRSSFLSFIDIFDWFAVSGRVAFKGVPKVDYGNNIIGVEDIAFDTETNNELVDGAVEIAKLPIVTELIRKSLSYEFGEDIEKVRVSVNKAMKLNLENNISINGTLDSAKVKNLTIKKEGLIANTSLKGNISVDMGK